MDKIINADAFEAFAVKAFKLTPEDVAGLYNEAGELTDFSLLSQKDTERITKFQTDSKNQYSRGLKEAAQKIEKEIKEKYEIDSDAIGVELIDHIIETKVSEVKGSDGEDVLKHPDVIKHLNALVKQHGKEKKALLDEMEQKIKNKENEIMEANTFKEVESAAIAEFESLNPILPEDPKKAKALKDILVNELKKFKHNKDKDGFSVLKEDGSVLMDEHGYPVTFSTHVKGIAERYFDFKKAEERSSSGNKEQNRSGSQKVRMPKDQEDYVTMMKDNSLTQKERVEIMNLYKSK
jgi:hypothetical protein